MIDFCRNRPEGFVLYGFFNHEIYLPTTCTIDNILVPIPTIALLIMLWFARPLRLFYSSSRTASRRLSVTREVLIDCTYDQKVSSYGRHLNEKQQPLLLSIEAEAAVVPQQPEEGRYRKWAKIFATVLKVYYYTSLFLLAFKLGREITLRVRANQGLGQLPLAVAGAIIVALIYVLDNRTKAHSRARVMTSCYWGSLSLILALKGLVLWRDLKTEATVSFQSYPISAQLVDCMGMLQAIIPMAIWDFNIYQTRTQNDEAGTVSLL